MSAFLELPSAEEIATAFERTVKLATTKRRYLHLSFEAPKPPMHGLVGFFQIHDAQQGHLCFCRTYFIT